jgi:hypothetical protein
MLSHTFLGEPSYQDEMLNMPLMGNQQTDRPRPASEKQPNDQTNPPANDTVLSAQDKSNFYGRWIENGRFFGEVPEAIVAEEYTSGNSDFDLQADGMVDKFSGFIIGTGFHFLFRSKYKKVRSLNPLYRNFKTLATAGTELGLIFYNLRYLPMVLSTAIFSLAVGILAIPYWVYRQYYSKTPVDLRNVYTRVGPEGWSKYAKTFLVFGMYLGEVIGNFVSFVTRGDFLRNIAIYGAIGSFVTFLAGLIAVPLINKFFDKKLISTKDAFRNNYVRSGITFGVALGSAIGFVIGTVAFPGLGSLAGMAMGAAFGSVIGGISLGVYGKKITTYLQRKWKVKENTDNSWDYATRNMSYLFGFIGAAIGFVVPVPGGALVGATLGTAVGGAIGWAAGFFVIRAARIVSPEETKSKVLPWTQRIANGTMVGSMIGATVGFLLGLIGGPAGAVLGATIGYSLGATIGGLGYGLYDKTSRKLLRHYFMGKTINAEIEPLYVAPDVTLELPSPIDSPEVAAPAAAPISPTLAAATTTPAPEKIELPPPSAPVEVTSAPDVLQPSSPKITAILLEQKPTPPQRSRIMKLKPELTIDTSMPHTRENHELESPIANKIKITTPQTVFFKSRDHRTVVNDMPDFTLAAALPIELKA